MSKLYTFIFCLVLTASGCSTYEEQSANSIDFPTGTLWFGGVEIEFPFIPDGVPITGTIAVTNHNNETVKIIVRDTTRGSVLVNKIVFGTGGTVLNNVEYVQGAYYAEGDAVELEIWYGLIDSLLTTWKFSSAPPDTEGTATLQIGNIAVNVGPVGDPYEIVLPTVKGVQFKLAGSHQAGAPTIQLYNALLGHNLGSDSVTARMYKIKGSPGSYSVDFEIAQHTLLVADDFTEPIGVTFFLGEVYTLRVSTITLPSTSDYACFKVDVAQALSYPETCTVSF